LRVAVLFTVGPRAVAILEIEMQILDRLALLLCDDARTNGLGK